MPIRIEAPDDMNWIYSEPDDAIRVDFDAWPLLEEAGLSVEEAEQDPERFVAVLEDLLGEDAETEMPDQG